MLISSIFAGGQYRLKQSVYELLSASASVLLVGVVAGCGGGSNATGASGSDLLPAVLSSSPTPVGPATPIGPERYVTVAFWQDATCSGAPNATTAFPLNYSEGQCFFSPGRSGENSVSNFSCGQNSFSYTQWTTLTCSGGQVPAGTRKTVTVAGCTQGVPPTQYARITDFNGCAK